VPDQLTGGERGAARASLPDRQSEGDARRIIDRVDREAAGTFRPWLMRSARHFAAGDADPADRVEVWGRRVGRALSLVGVIVLTWLLVVQLSS
jgi:hypothetical protein